MTPPEHNLKRGGGKESRRAERLADPKAPHLEPSGREQRRARERREAKGRD